MRVGSLFSGYGGLDMAVKAVLGAHVVWHCDVDPGASALLAHHWPDVPNLGDITSADFRGGVPVDVLTGGFPCQDVSTAGLRAGMREGSRSGLWVQMARAVDELRPRLVVIENVRGLLSARTAHSRDVEVVGPRGGRRMEHTHRALGTVLGDLADLGYDAAWCGLRAADVGAAHGRFRVFIAAWPADAEPDDLGWCGPGAHGDGGLDLRTAVSLLPTPSVADGTGGHLTRSGARSGELLLPGVAKAVGESQDWGKYAAAVRRWESLTRPAPSPVYPGSRRLDPAFSEWLMGLPAGHITGVPGLSRAAQLKLAGNGVVPQQAVAALLTLLRVRCDALTR